MANPDLLKENVRSAIIDEIKSEENLTRKREHQKRYDIYRDKQDKYILERLNREFDRDTVQEMRKIFSINLSKRIIDESLVYKKSPERSYMLGDGEASEQQVEQLDVIYKKTRADNALKVSNSLYKNHDQSFLMVVPDNMGGLKVRALGPHQVDVIPDEKNPEKAYAYILSVWDKDFHESTKNLGSERTQFDQYRFNDRINQKIADNNDRQAKLGKYIVWTDEYHFMMDGRGKIIDEIVPNPIGRMPIIDVSMPDAKDFQFFVEYGSNIAEFSIDFGLLLSDLANTIRLQNYSQAIIYSDKQPQDMTVGPNKVMWIEINPDNPSFRPSFEFQSPNPDLNGSMEFLENFVRFFLSSKGLEPGTISGKSDARTFSSGIERLLSLLDRFEATREDFDLMEYVEKELFELIVLWQQTLYRTTGESALDEEYQKIRLPDDMWMEPKFHEPQAIQTAKEREESAMSQLDAGLMSRAEAIAEIRDIPIEKAREVLEEILKDEEEYKPEPPPMIPGQMPPNMMEEEDGEDEEEESV